MIIMYSLYLFVAIIIMIVIITSDNHIVIVKCVIVRHVNPMVNVMRDILQLLLVVIMVHALLVMIIHNVLEVIPIVILRVEPVRVVL